MPSFSEIANEICEKLCELNFEYHRILFGKSEDFKKWLDEHNVEENVSN